MARELMIRDPFDAAFLSLREAIDRLFDQAFVRPFDGFAPRSVGMPMNIYELPDRYHVAILVPGVRPESLEVQAMGSSVTIRGEVALPEVENEKNAAVLRCEWTGGRFARTIEFGDPIDAEHIDARLENGVLHLTVPKAESVRPRVIKVQMAR
ncbi:MAG TPA: Hsp20/alpha crystallin family protein [Thermoflexus sp.]|nr:Hsp20/alpha crystallin family protein [Thermoflexus sp.]